MVNVDEIEELELAIEYLENQKKTYPKETSKIDERVEELRRKIMDIEMEKRAQEIMTPEEKRASAEGEAAVNARRNSKESKPPEKEALGEQAKLAKAQRKEIKRDKGRQETAEREEKETGGARIKATREVGMLGFWLVLALVLNIFDYAYWHFGGIDYNVFISAIQSGGLGLLWRIMMPIYVLLFLIIILALKSAASRRVGFFLLVFFIPLIIANYLERRYMLTNLPYIGLSLTILALIISTVIVVWSMSTEDRYGFLSWVLLVITASTIISLNGLYDGWHHLLVAFLIWVFVIKEEGQTWAKPNYIISVLLIMDFFGFGILKAFAPNALIANRLVFPVWFLFLVFYTAEQKKSTFAKILMVAVIIFYIFALVEGVYGWVNIRAQAKLETAETEQAKGFFTRTVEKIRSFPQDIKKEYERGMEQATGGYYQSKVEENEDPNSKLGVYLENIQAADKQFDADEEVVIWGDLKARTLDEPIYVYMSCDSDKEIGIIKPDVLSNKDSKYEIDKFEEIGFECGFSPGQLKPGMNNINLRVEFNFETLAFLKTYFMDIERIRALRRENIDPLDQYGIKDKKSYGVSTYGPIKLGMGSADPPIGLYQRREEQNKSFESYTYVGITVENQWMHGRIKNITTIRIQIPDKLGLEPEKEDNLYCRGDFEEDRENEEGYWKYKMTEESLRDIKTPIAGNEFRSWRCSIKIDPSDAKEILGNTPVAIYYYRASASYIYEIAKSISINIKSATDIKTMLKNCTIVCDNSYGCICGAKNCTIQEGGEIKVGETCNG